MQAGAPEKDHRALQGRQHERKRVGRHAIQARVATCGFLLHNWRAMPESVYLQVEDSNAKGKRYAYSCFIFICACSS